MFCLDIFDEQIYYFILVQHSAIITQSIFTQIVTKDTP